MFFEPMPHHEPPEPGPWAPPLWDRPSEGTLPAVLPVNEIVLRGPSAVVAVDELRVYPNGFVVNVLIMDDPQTSRSGTRGTLVMGGMGAAVAANPMVRFPRIGVRFADGRTAGDTAGGSPYDIPKDDRGIPTAPWLQYTGGGGGGVSWRMGVWVFPLPPPGPLEIFVALAAIAEEEGRIVVDGDAVRAASTRATVIWQ